MTHSFDMDFANAVRAAADGDIESLVEILRSDAPIGRGERDLLADYVSGEFNRARGRPSKSKIPTDDMRRSVAEYLNRTEAGEKGEAVAAEICDRLGISRSKFHAHIERWKRMEAFVNGMGPGMNFRRTMES